MLVNMSLSLVPLISEVFPKGPWPLSGEYTGVMFYLLRVRLVQENLFFETNSF